LRAKILAAALRAFEPDVLVVDKEPCGAVRELEPALRVLRACGRTRCVLGLRDVLDDPTTVRQQWDGAANQDTIRRYYEAVWVYGAPAVYDPVREYHFGPEVAAKVAYTGYLDPCSRSIPVPAGGADPPSDSAALPDRFALCVVGGGQDGVSLAEAFAWAEFPPGTGAVIVTGPFMPAEARQRLHLRAAGVPALAGRPRLGIVEFVPDPGRLLSRADQVVAMGGYNTVCEVLSFGKPTLIVPRVSPRREQLIRAERLRALGLLDVLQPDEATPQALSRWLARAPSPPPRARDRIDMNGTERLPGLLTEVLARPLPRPRGLVTNGVQNVAP